MSDPLVDRPLQDVLDAYGPSRATFTWGQFSQLVGGLSDRSSSLGSCWHALSRRESELEMLDVCIGELTPTIERRQSIWLFDRGRNIQLPVLSWTVLRV